MHDDYEPEQGDEFEELDIADEVSLADTGRPWAYRAIKHPSHSKTRQYLKANPLPEQGDRRWTA